MPSFTYHPKVIVADFSKTLEKWRLQYRHDEPEHSKHNVVCRFLNLFPVKDIIATALASNSESSASDYVVWDSISVRYNDIYDMLFDKDTAPDPEAWSNLDFVISLIVSDADEELCDQLMRENIDFDGLYLFDHWVGPTSASMESSTLYEEE